MTDKALNMYNVPVHDRHYRKIFVLYCATLNAPTDSCKCKCVFAAVSFLQHLEATAFCAQVTYAIWCSGAECAGKATSYPPQRSCGQGNIFANVCHSVHRGGVCIRACWDTTPPWGADTPSPGEQTHAPQIRHTPRSTYPPRADIPLPEQTPSPPPEAATGIRSMSGRYASYWNAF